MSQFHTNDPPKVGRHDESHLTSETDAIRRLAARRVPAVFRSAIDDWLRIISEADLPNFHTDLTYAEDLLNRNAGHYPSLYPGQRRKPLILHMDDDPALQTLIQKMIAVGFRGQVLVTSMVGGGGSLVLASTLQPDLVITDVMEPGLSGFDVARYLKKNPATRNVPLIFLSASGGRDNMLKKGMALGAKEYLSKPILQHDLVAVVERVMHIRAQGSHERG